MVCPNYQLNKSNRPIVHNRDRESTPFLLTCLGGAWGAWARRWRVGRRSRRPRPPAWTPCCTAGTRWRPRRAARRRRRRRRRPRRATPARRRSGRRTRSRRPAGALLPRSQPTTPLIHKGLLKTSACGFRVQSWAFPHFLHVCPKVPAQTARGRDKHGWHAACIYSFEAACTGGPARQRTTFC